MKEKNKLNKISILVLIVIIISLISVFSKIAEAKSFNKHVNSVITKSTLTDKQITDLKEDKRQKDQMTNNLKVKEEKNNGKNSQNNNENKDKNKNNNLDKTKIEKDKKENKSESKTENKTSEIIKKEPGSKSLINK